MRTFLVVLACWFLSVVRLDAEERWFVGTLADQPMASLHQVERALPEGGHECVTTTLLAIRRSLPGQPELRLEIRETQIFAEDTAGSLRSFHFDHDENGTVVTAEGVIADGRVSGTIARLGRTTPIAIPLTHGVTLLGDRAAQMAMIATDLAPGATTSFASLALLNGQVVVVTNAVTGRGVQDGERLFDVVPDVMPLPMRLRLSSSGELRQMSMNLGVMVLELRPAAGPVALLGAEVPPTGLVKARGPALRLDVPNRLRLPPGPAVPLNPFQHEADGIITLQSSPTAEVLSEQRHAELLQPGAQLELDDPALRKWVSAQLDPSAASASERAERLRLAVRSHITTKDLSKGDASALETFRTRTGDCTEHATLLCAALRIAGIPARIEVGLIYAPDYGGWVGHAWNSAYVDDHWIHLDSAYPGIPRSCYLCLGFPEKVQTGATMLVQLNRFMGQTLETLPFRQP